uniref:Uncharacterized protein n=1 Tax=Trichogramma kaykai TaxID=54128 RepID=A0ABD2WD04_9HYME
MALRSSFTMTVSLIKHCIYILYNFVLRWDAERIQVKEESNDPCSDAGEDIFDACEDKNHEAFPFYKSSANHTREAMVWPEKFSYRIPHLAININKGFIIDKNLRLK